MRKFSGQGLNPCHNGNNAGSLHHQATREFLRMHLTEFSVLNTNHTCLLYKEDVAIFFFFLSFVFLGPHPQQMEVPRPGVELELLLLACTRATPAPDLSCVCDLNIPQLTTMPDP